MKLTFIIALIFAFNLLIPEKGFAEEKQPVKHALIIAVADYPDEGGWADISSDNDVALIKDALLRQGFEENNIKVVMNDKAKKEDIVAYLREIKENVSAGDIVTIHYSGHGQQIQDDNGDELDGYDEALVPWDAHLRMSDDYKGEKHLRDDEIQVLTDAIREKLGKDGNLMLILDACHSGTASRGITKSRGTHVKFSDEGYEPPSRSDEGSFGEITQTGDGELSPMITLSGASQHELNYEYYDAEKDTYYGSLSYAVSFVLSDADAEATYRSMFDEILVKMSTIAPRQAPQIEGDVDYKLFRGEVVEPKPYFMVEDFYEDDNTATINAGSLMGVFDSTKVAFYPIGTYDLAKEQPLAEGTIVFSSAIESDVALDREVGEEAIKNSWVYITSQNFGDNDLNVSLDVNNERVERLVSDKLKDYPKIKIVDEAPDLLVEMNNEFSRGNRIQLITNDELELYSKEIASDEDEEQAVDEVFNRIERYMQANLLKKIDVKDESVEVMLEIIPVTLKKVGRRYQVDEELDAEDMRTEGNELVFTEDNYFRLKIKNNGYKRAYFQVLNIRPDNEVSMLYPSVEDSRPASEFVIDMGEEIMLEPIFVFQEPFGKEYIKLIATESPVDLRFLVQTRGAEGTRGPNPGPFEQLLKDSFKGTRAGVLSVPPASANVHTIPIRVKKAD